MEFTGGIHYGQNYYVALNATWPLAHLEIGPERLLLSTIFLRTFTFPRESISRLSRYGGFLSVGLRIEHRNPDYPPFIVFWTFNLSKLKASLIENGFEVVQGDAGG